MRFVIATLTIGYIVLILGCLFQSGFIEEFKGANLYQDSVSVVLEMVEPSVPRTTTNEYIEGLFTLYPSNNTGPAIISHSKLRRPLARLSVINHSSVSLLVPDGNLYPSWRNLANRNRPRVEFRFGVLSGWADTLTVRQRIPEGISADRPIISYPHGHDYFHRLNPGETAVVLDSIDLTLGLARKALPAGQYWLVVWIRNGWTKPGHSEYWTGEIASDTIQFRLEDN